MKLRIPTSCVALATITASLLLAACGDKVLDFRNAQINNGKVYARDSNTPFSGKLTNIPANSILRSQQGVQRLASFVGDLGNAAPYGGAVPYSICDASIHDGGPDGEVVCKPEQSDTVIVISKFSDGVVDGPYTVYDKTGNNKAIEATFRNGALDGNVKVYSPQTGKPVVTATWNAGVLNGEEEAFDETTGNRVLHATLVHDKYDGEFTRYAPDGKQIIYKANFAQGQHDGDEETFDPQTGRMTGQAHYADGKLDGVAKAWDANGQLIKEVTYDHGVRQPTVDEIAAQATADAKAQADLQANTDAQERAAAVSACVQHHHDEFHKQTGTYTNSPTLEQTAEWQKQCEVHPGG
ncbi:toxin-antitoxin system YwqK family antitoxin [Caballeronia novacaledonica]|uniref:toxin-antitoxin system YwqK family antitoxin n=1 Tax=Caballeronia novacaledonica TaxID=1544861 RepID=UPI001EE1ECDF|nr:toxin-antitoxin system YwqK family antitoxin [Caballeronia novacaledonica]GJH07723.1 toxin-antitoxin system YwqK family antitoxin [Caballeronia novacaledonica]